LNVKLFIFREFSYPVKETREEIIVFYKYKKGAVNKQNLLKERYRVKSHIIDEGSLYDLIIQRSDIEGLKDE